jgi:RNA polymerase sigma-70 factor (ECF subfamily)
MSDADKWVHLTVEQATAALDALTDADRLRLLKLASLRAPAGMVASDLLQEALVRVLGGERHLPAGVAVVPALDKIMNSVALTEIKARSRQPVDSLTLVGADDGSDRQRDVVDPDGSPEDRMASAQDAKYGAILALFRDDDQPTYAVEALAAEVPPAEIRKDLGISQTQWNSLRRLIRRRVDAAFPKEHSS